MTSRPTIRLACDNCDRGDHDGITRSQLKAAVAAGWRGVARGQTYRQACRTYDRQADEPPGFGVLDWYTHIGTCPGCVAAEGG